MSQRIYTTVLEEFKLEHNLKILKLESLKNILPREILRKFKNFPYFGDPVIETYGVYTPSELHRTLEGDFANIYFSNGEPLLLRDLVHDYLSFSKSVLIVARNEEKCIGGVWYEPQNPKTGIIPAHIIVEPDYRNNGVGIELERISARYIEQSAKYHIPRILQFQWPIHREETNPEWFEKRGYFIIKESNCYFARKVLKQ